MVLDLVVIGILFVSAALAFMRGFVREILTIGGLIGAALATWMFGPSLTPTVQGWIVDPNATQPQQLFGLIPYEMLAPVIAFAIVFGVVLVGLSIVTHMISKGVHSVGLGPADRSLGVVFGLARGVILIGLMMLVLNFVFSDKQREQYFGDSKTYPYASYTADLMHALLPGRDVVDKKPNKDILALTGRQPLEPGQAGKGRRGGADKAMPRTAKTSASAEPMIPIQRRYND